MEGSSSTITSPQTSIEEGWCDLMSELPLPKELPETGEDPDFSEYKHQNDWQNHTDSNVDKILPAGMCSCLCCHKSFIHRNQFRLHMRDHARDSTLKCRWCNKKHQNLKTLLDHLNTHGEETLICFICGFRGKDKNEMEQHISATDIHKRLNKSSLKKSKLLMEKCKYCDFQTFERNKMTIHRFNNHIKPKCIIPPGLKYELSCHKACTDCGEVFSSMTNLNRHKKIHNTGKLLFSCGYCEYRSDFPRAVEKHLQKVHEDLQIRFKCALCSFNTAMLPLLKTHITVDRHLSP